MTGGKRPNLRYRLRQRRGKSQGGQPRGARRLLQQDVYYLMVVNMPSEAELQAAAEEQRRVERYM